MAIRNKNLNLIPVLQALLKHESVVGAATEVGLSQPAMSGSLARLRELLDDELLVRVGRSMRLTPRAAHLRDQVDEACARIEQLFVPEQFDPSVARGCFWIATPDYIAFLLTKALITRLAEEAPGVELHFVDVPLDIVGELERSTIDLLVCADFGHWPDLRREFVFKEHYVVAGAKDHPLLAKDAVTHADLADYPCPAVNYSSSFPTAESRRWRSGIPIVDQPSQISSMNQFNGMLLAATSHTIARAPATLARSLGDILSLKVIELADENADFDTCMFWTATTERSQEHRWLRSIIAEALAPYDQVAEKRPG